MKGFRYAIMALAGFCLGWGAHSLVGIGMRKSANSRFLSESEITLKSARAAISRFQAREKRFPGGVQELLGRGYLEAANMPVESMRRGARWVGAWDGMGGFVYDKVTGEIFLNADVSREKFFRADWKRVLEGDLFPKGKIY